MIRYDKLHLLFGLFNYICEMERFLPEYLVHILAVHITHFTEPLTFKLHPVVGRSPPLIACLYWPYVSSHAILLKALPAMTQLKCVKDPTS